MIKRILTVFTLIVLTTAALLWVGQAQTLAKSPPAAGAMENANQLYQSGRFELAAQSYQQLANQGFADSALFFNLGNAYFERHDLGRAILNFRLAQQLAPRDAATTANLELARVQVATHMAQIETTGKPGWVERIARTVESWVTLNQLALLALAAWLLTALLWIAAGSRRTAGRLQSALRATLAAAALVLVVSATSLGSLLATRSAWPPGVVVAESIAVSAAPGGQTESQFMLPGGAEVAVMETRGSWARVTIPHTAVQGWVPVNAVERVTF